VPKRKILMSVKKGDLVIHIYDESIIPKIPEVLKYLKSEEAIVHEGAKVPKVEEAKKSKVEERPKEPKVEKAPSEQEVHIPKLEEEFPSKPRKKRKITDVIEAVVADDTLRKAVFVTRDRGVIKVKPRRRMEIDSEEFKMVDEKLKQLGFKYNISDEEWILEE